MKQHQFLAIILSMMFLNQFASAQNLLKSNNKTEYTYIYKLNNEAAIEIFKNKFISDSSKYFTNLVDSFLIQKPENYKERLSPGQYILYNANGKNLSFNLLEISDIIVKINGLNNKSTIYIYDLNGNPILKDISVYNEDGKIIPFNDEWQCWSIDNINKSVQYFYILKNDALSFYMISKNLSSVQQIRRKTFNRILPGYFVLNQPSYKINDSLLFKAFLLKKNGKPYTKTVGLKIWDSRQSKYVLIQDLKPLSKGAYSYKIKIPDSFSLDTEYYIYLCDKKGRIVKSKNFKVENYSVKNAVYSARLEKSSFYKGEDVYLHLSCFDANNLPISDAKISVNLTIANIQDFFTDSIFIPYKWNSDSYWNKEFFSDPSGNTEILIPDSLFLDARMQFNVNISFTNADGESTKQNLNFNYDPKRHRYLFYQTGDSIKAVFLEDSKATKKKGIIASYSGNLIEKKEVVLPFTFQIEEFPKYYILFEDTIPQATVYPKNADANLVKFEGYRNYDSIVLKLVNNAGVKINYWIYQKNKIIQKGIKTDLKINTAMKGGESIDIIYSYRLAGEKYTFTQSFHHSEKTLKIVADLPRVIYPGEDVVVKLNVKNHKGKNLKNVNLAAYAINAQLEGIETPEMPYFGKEKSNAFSTFSTHTESLNISAYKQIDTNYIEWLNLRDISYYNFMYSKEGFIMEYDSIEPDETEFAPYFISKGNLMNINEIYIDTELAYFDKSSYLSSYSLRVEPGIHQVVLRTANEFITINDVEFKKGFKLFLGLEKDSIYKFNNIEYVQAKPQYFDEEKAQINDRLLVFINRMTESFYIQQNNQILNSTKINNSNYRYSGLTVVGPIKPGKLRVITMSYDTLEFFFQPGFVYQFTDTLININDKYGMNYSQNYLNYHTTTTINFYGGARADTNPTPKHKIYKKPVQKPNIFTMRNYDTSSSLKTYGSLTIKFPSQRRIIRTYLINESDSLNSKYYTYYNLNPGNIKGGNYRLYYLASDSSYYSRSLFVEEDGTNYRYYSDTVFAPKDSNLLKSIESLIINLNTPKARVFDSPPKIINIYKPTTYKNKFNITYFKGTILDSNLNPVNNAIIILERNGIFIRGAYTNEAGSFLFIDSLEGNYQLKIFVNYKQYNYYNTLIYKNLTNTVDMILPDKAAPVLFYSNDSYANSINEPSYFINGANAGSYQFIAPMESEVVQLSAASIETIKGINKVRVIKGKTTAMFGDLLNENAGEKNQNKMQIMADSTVVSINHEQDRFEKLSDNQTANRIRSDFRDYAFFIPNLLTNKKGEVYFTVQFPDNQTMWKTFFPAVDYHKNTGLLEVNVQSYKPLSASIALPAFLIQGDECIINGKISNYIGIAYPLIPWYKIQNDSVSMEKTAPEHFQIFPKNLSFQDLGKKTIVFGLKTDNGYLDAEQRNIPVLINGIEVSSSNHYYAKNDFSLNLPANKKLVSRTLFITNNQLDVLNQEIEYLKNYSYGCNEQNASKIRALLAEKSIKKTLNLPFENEKLIKSLINKLEKTQNRDGSWGWWNEGDKPETWMTIYITEALNIAAKSGYSSKAGFKAVAYLEKNINNLNTSEMLYALEVLCDYNSPEKYKSHLVKADQLKLSYTDGFRLIRLKQKAGLSYSVQEIIQSSNRDRYGLYWGDNVMNFKVNIIQTSSLAYKILKNDITGHKVILEETRNYFLNHLSPNRNTIERAVLLQDITDDIVSANSISNEIRAELKINGKIMAQEYPIILKFSNSEAIYIEKTGAPLQISVYETSIVNPEKKADSVFTITTVFRCGIDTISITKIGEKFSHFGKFAVKKDAEFVMLEIPILAGSVFSNKNSSRLPYETYREYHDDKVVIFFRSIPKGNYSFSIDLQARFAGKFNSIPSKVSLMYFPDVYSFSKSDKLTILEK